MFSRVDTPSYTFAFHSKVWNRGKFGAETAKRRLQPSNPFGLLPQKGSLGPLGKRQKVLWEPSQSKQRRRPVFRPSQETMHLAVACLVEAKAEALRFGFREFSLPLKVGPCCVPLVFRSSRFPPVPFLTPFWVGRESP